MKGCNLPTRLLVATLLVGMCALELLYGNSISKTMRRDTSWIQGVEDITTSSMASPSADAVLSQQSVTPAVASKDTQVAGLTKETSQKFIIEPSYNSSIAAAFASNQQPILQCRGDLTLREQYNQTFSSLTSDQLDMSDPIFRRQAWDNDPFVIESHKLLFFTVPKNSCTEWKRLFKRMLNHSDWSMYGNARVHNPNTNRLKYFGNYSKQQQMEFMTSPEWTRAIFIRDPFQRLLSGYLDKALGDERYVQYHCCKSLLNMKFRSEMARKQCMVLNRLEQQKRWPAPNKDFPFATFVTAFMAQCKDPHWEQQSKRLKHDNWKFINFVGYFENLEHDARCLLEKIGAWEEYGASGWGKDGNQSFFHRNTAPHSTSAKDQHSTYYTPDVMQRAWQYLKPDYEMPIFEFTKPEGVVSSKSECGTRICQGINKKTQTN
jgi:hypothetical protein